MFSTTMFSPIIKDLTFHYFLDCSQGQYTYLPPPLVIVNTNDNQFTIIVFPHSSAIQSKALSLSRQPLWLDCDP